MFAVVVVVCMHEEKGMKCKCVPHFPGSLLSAQGWTRLLFILGGGAGRRALGGFPLRSSDGGCQLVIKQLPTVAALLALFDHTGMG